MFAENKCCAVTTAGRNYAASRKQKEKNYFFFADRAHGCQRTNGAHHIVSKQRLYYNRGTVFLVQSVTGLIHELTSLENISHISPAFRCCGLLVCFF
jgi:hypothetical protein